MDNNGDNPAGTKEFTYAGIGAAFPSKAIGVYLYVGETIR